MYFIPRMRTWLAWRPILTVALLLLFTVISVRLNVLLSYQGNDMLTAMQQLNAPAFWKSIGIFGILATVYVVLVLISFYIGQAQIIHWRLWLNQRMVGDWLSGTAYHRMKFVSSPVDNPDQRIQQDITSLHVRFAGFGFGSSGVFCLAGLLHHHPLAAVRSGHRLWTTDSASDGLPCVRLRDHRDRFCLPDREAAHSAELSQ
jgi:hypothetical protein